KRLAGARASGRPPSASPPPKPSPCRGATSTRPSRCDHGVVTMSFLLEGNYLFYLFVAGSTVLFVEAGYLLCFSAHSYRSSINRRLRLMKNQSNRENVLIQLRRERGLTGAGSYAMRIL